MKFLSEMDKPRSRRLPQHYFQSEETALKHLKDYSIEPNGKRFVIISEHHYGDKNFDALDYLMYNHQYLVHFV